MDELYKEDKIIINVLTWKQGLGGKVSVSIKYTCFQSLRLYEESPRLVPSGPSPVPSMMGSLI